MRRANDFPTPAPSLGGVKVEIWSDVVCPWCHVGKARFEEAVRRLGWDESELEFTFRPFELDPRVGPGRAAGCARIVRHALLDDPASAQADLDEEFRREEGTA